MRKCFSLFLLSITLSIALLAIPGNDTHAATVKDTAPSILDKSSAPWVGDTLWGTLCDGKGQGFGPYDYTQRSRYLHSLQLVEGAHFTPQVENLASGHTGKIMGDIDYTLRAWPNHHRALNSVIRYRLRNKDNFALTNPRDTPAECYLQRAINFSPKDGVSQMLYGMLLQQMGRPEDALGAYQTAERLEPNDVQIKYNMGLLLVELERYEEAKEYALDVYAMKFPLPGLMRQLKEKGYWEDDAE